MRTRDASASLSGYYYQFDKTIQEILKLDNDTHSITVEGIEDIDIRTASESTAIQCKYYPGSTITNSDIAKPIQLMLEHYIENKNCIDSYRLYIHANKDYGNDISIDRLKSILKYKKGGKKIDFCRDKNIADTDLHGFLDKFKLIHGTSLESQQHEIIENLKNYFKCSEYEAETLYYSNALKIVFNLAIKKDIISRRITKKDFLLMINNKDILYNLWYINKKGIDSYIDKTRNYLRTFNYWQKETAIIISQETIERSKEIMTFFGFVDSIIDDKYKKLESVPLTIIIDGSIDEIRQYKKQLVENKFSFSDGYEGIIFSPYFFDSRPVINTNKSKSGITRTSFEIRIISGDSLKNNLSNVRQFYMLINFTNQVYYNQIAVNGHKHHVIYCENLNQISRILN